MYIRMYFEIDIYIYIYIYNGNGKKIAARSQLGRLKKDPEQKKFYTAETL